MASAPAWAQGSGNRDSRNSSCYGIYSEGESEFPHLTVKALVRGGEMLNDATVDGAVYSGLSTAAEIITNVLYYTNQCPFNAKYVLILQEIAEQNGIPFKAVMIENRGDAQNAPTPVTTYALFFGE